MAFQNHVGCDRPKSVYLIAHHTEKLPCHGINEILFGCSGAFNFQFGALDNAQTSSELVDAFKNLL